MLTYKTKPKTKNEKVLVGGGQVLWWNEPIVVVSFILGTSARWLGFPRLAHTFARVSRAGEDVVPKHGAPGRGPHAAGVTTDKCCRLVVAVPVTRHLSRTNVILCTKNKNKNKICGQKKLFEDDNRRLFLLGACLNFFLTFITKGKQHRLQYITKREMKWIVTKKTIKVISCFLRAVRGMEKTRVSKIQSRGGMS